jgi:UDP-N-acetylmuramyl pentapeptide synthase
LAAALGEHLVSGDTVLIKGSNGAKMTRVIDALKADIAAGAPGKSKAG